MNISVIIITFNPKAWLVKCLDSIRTSEVKVDVIIIDNGSTDGSQEIIKNNYPEIDFIQSNDNLGFGKANNIGIKKAYDKGADYFFLMNQDVYIKPSTIINLINKAEQNTEYGILSPIHLNGSGLALDYNFSNYISPIYCTDFYSDVFTKNIKDSIYELKFVNAAAWLLSKKCIETVGGFSPSFYHYGEDDNFCQRVCFHKLKIGIVPDSIIYHDREQRKENKYFDNRDIAEIREIFKLYSNPNTKHKPKELYIKVIKTIVRLFFSLRLKSIKFQLKKIMLYNSIDFNLIEKNRETSKKVGCSFLNNLEL